MVPSLLLRHANTHTHTHTAAHVNHTHNQINPNGFDINIRPREENISAYRAVRQLCHLVV